MQHLLKFWLCSSRQHPPGACQLVMLMVTPLLEATCLHECGARCGLTAFLSQQGCFNYALHPTNTDVPFPFWELACKVCTLQSLLSNPVMGMLNQCRLKTDVSSVHPRRPSDSAQET